MNKVNTKAELRLDLRRADWIPTVVQAQIRQREKNRVNKEDVLVVTSTQFRTQQMNLKDALDRVDGIIQGACEAAAPPKEPSAAKQKRIKKLKRKDNRKRLDSKKKLSDKKNSRRSRSFD